MKSLLILCCGLAIAGCGSRGKVPLVVYSPHGKELLSHYEKEYETLHTGVDVQWLDMGSQDAYDRIRTELGNPQADLWWGAPMTIFERASREGLLERYVPSWDSASGPGEKSPEGFWYGTFLTPEVIVYNTRMVRVDEAPRDWDDLLDPRWRDKIIIRSPLSSGTMRIIFSALIQRAIDRGGTEEDGFTWLRSLDRNTKTYASDPTQLYVKIAREEGAITVWNLPDIALQQEIHNAPFGTVMPLSGTPLITDGIAIVRGTKQRKEAERFYEFVTSTQSMIEQATLFHRIPARHDIPPDQLPAWVRDLAVRPMPLDWQRVALHETAWMKTWDEEIKGRGTTGMKGE
jgi:iron(III) transport system substrate-binding protein